MTLHWHTEPLLLLGLFVPAWLYALWIGPLSPPGLPPAGRVRPPAFYLGLLLTYLAVGSPLDQLGEQYLFSAHMGQHLLLMYVTPVLFVVGLPPAHTDHLLRRFRWLRGGLRPFLHPVTAGVLFSICFSLWHIPVLYELALANKTIHILEHVTIWLPSLFVCWNLFARSTVIPPLSHPACLLMLFILTVAQLPVFGVLTMSGEILYPTYEWAPRIIDLSPIDDQVLGGLLMKVGGMFFVFPLFAWHFFQWSRKSEQEDRMTSPALPPNPRAA